MANRAASQKLGVATGGIAAGFERIAVLCGDFGPRWGEYGGERREGEGRDFWILVFEERLNLCGIEDAGDDLSCDDFLQQDEGAFRPCEKNLQGGLLGTGPIGGPVFEECARDFGGGMAAQRLDCSRLNAVGLALGKARCQRV